MYKIERELLTICTKELSLPVVCKESSHVIVLFLFF